MIDKKIEDAANNMMVAARKELDKICLDAGMTAEEIQKVVTEALSDVRLNGVPIFSSRCEHCDGRGWIKP